MIIIGILCVFLDIIMMLSITFAVIRRWRQIRQFACFGFDEWCGTPKKKTVIANDSKNQWWCSHIMLLPTLTGTEAEEQQQRRMKCAAAKNEKKNQLFSSWYYYHPARCFNYIWLYVGYDGVMERDSVYRIWNNTHYPHYLYIYI